MYFRSIQDELKQFFDYSNISLSDLFLFSFSIALFFILLSSILRFLKTVFTSRPHCSSSSSDSGKSPNNDIHVDSCKFCCLHSECPFYNSPFNSFCMKCDRYSMCSHCIHEGKCKND